MPFTPRIGTILVSVVGLFGSILAFVVIPRYGRVPILIVGYAAIAICHFSIGFLTIYKVDIGVLVFLCLF